MPDSFTRIRQALEPLADPARAAEMTAYMRGRFPFLGIGTPARRTATMPILRTLREFDTDLVTACFDSEEREYQYVACDHIRRVGITDLDLAERLVRTKSWWDTVDALAKPIGANHADATMRDWATHGDFWVRRVAILHQLGRKTDTDLDLLAWIIRQNLGSGEFFINKAVGWALRDLAHHDPAWVRAFVDATDLHSLSRREALKNL